MGKRRMLLSEEQGNEMYTQRRYNWNHRTAETLNKKPWNIRCVKHFKHGTIKTMINRSLKQLKSGPTCIEQQRH